MLPTMITLKINNYFNYMYLLHYNVVLQTFISTDYSSLVGIVTKTDFIIYLPEFI